MQNGRPYSENVQGTKAKDQHRNKNVVMNVKLV